MSRRRALGLTSLLQAFNLFSVIIQVAWTVISVAGLGRVCILNRITRFRRAEQAVTDAGLSGLSRI